MRRINSRVLKYKKMHSEITIPFAKTFELNPWKKYGGWPYRIQSWRFRYQYMRKYFLWELYMTERDKMIQYRRANLLQRLAMQPLDDEDGDGMDMGCVGKIRKGTFLETHHAER